MSLVEQLAPNLVVGFVIPVRGPDLGCAISMPFGWNVCCVVRNVFFDKNTLWNDTQMARPHTARPCVVRGPGDRRLKTTGGLLTLPSFRAHSFSALFQSILFGAILLFGVIYIRILELMRLMRDTVRERGKRERARGSKKERNKVCDRATQRETELETAK